MTRPELIEAVLTEMHRVWGDEGFGGTFPEYEWLLANYGITEEEDVQWQFVLQYHMDGYAGGRLGGRGSHGIR